MICSPASVTTGRALAVAAVGAVVVAGLFSIPDAEALTPPTGPSVTTHSALPTSTRAISGGGTIDMGSELARFTVDVSGSPNPAGSCDVTGTGTSGWRTTIRCTSFTELRKSGNTATMRGTALYNGRQVSYTATVVDGGQGRQDHVTVTSGGDTYFWQPTAGDIVVS